MDSIAKLADVSKQTLYAHFKKKDLLFLHCMKESSHNYQVSKLVFDWEAPIEEVLLDFAIMFQTSLLETNQVNTYRNAVSQIESHPEFSATYLAHGPQKTLEVMTEYLDAKVKDGTIALATSSQDAAIQLLLMFHGKSVYWRYLGEDIKETKKQRYSYLKSCVDMFLHQVRVA